MSQRQTADRLAKKAKRREELAADSICRLFVLLARDASRGVIFRRGPSAWVQLTAWNTAEDTFESGQWFHGNVYERRADLSPDGKHLVYLAAKFTRRQYTTSIGMTWTAVSRPPYLTAVALWPNATRTYGGGGLFIDNDTLLLDHYFDPIPHPDFLPPNKLHYYRVQGGGHGEDFPVYEYRLLRDGWQKADAKEDYKPAYPPKYPCDPLLIYEKRGVNDRHDLVFIIFGFGGGSSWYNIEYRLRSCTTGKEYPLAGVTWADFDQQGRLVFTRAGKLFSADWIASDPAVPFIEKELADFTGEKFKRIIAPDWAKRW